MLPGQEEWQAGVVSGENAAAPQPEPGSRPTPAAPCPRPRTRSRVPRSVVALAVISALLVTAWLTVCIRTFATPVIDPQQQVDAIYLLGPTQHLDEAAVALVRDQKLAPLLLMTAAVDPTTGADYSSTHCGETTASYRVECVLPEPYDTRGEAQLLRSQAVAHDWRSVAVITTKGHLPRARLLMDQCVPARVVMWDNGSDNSLTGWLMTFVHESAAWTSARLSPEC